MRARAWRWLILTTVAALVGTPSTRACPPAAAVEVAWRDAVTQKPGDWKYLRYLDMTAFVEADHEWAQQVLAYLINSQSRHPDLRATTLVTSKINTPNGLEDVYLLRINSEHYKWDLKVWELLLEAPEPYFHLTLVYEETSYYWAGGVWKGTYFPPGMYKRDQPKKVKKQAHAPWTLNEREAQSLLECKKSKEVVGEAQVQAWILKKTSIGRLSTMLESNIPIIRADWFFTQTATAKKRVADYYQWLGLKKLKDAEDLAGLNREVASKIFREVAAIIKESGVAFNARQTFRFGAQSGGWWETRDTDEEVGKKNALTQLDRDFDFVALEIYFFLPNDLFGYVAADNKGALQDSVPDIVAGDKQTKFRDTKIQPAFSCMACHLEGLRPLARDGEDALDWGRRTFRIVPGEPGARIQHPDPKVLERLYRLYLIPLEDKRQVDIEQYSRALKRLNGWTPREAAEAVERAWIEWFDNTVTFEQAARESGTTKEKLREVLLRMARPPPNGTGNINPVLADFLPRPDPKDPKKEVFGTVKRAMWEEVFGTVQIALAGAIP